jgi:OST-HTH/LOTUS domain
MEDQFGVGLKPHDIAQLLISTWRGSCLDIYARGEQIIGQTLEAMRAKAKDYKLVKLQHLAGQRAGDLLRYVDKLSLTASDRLAVISAMNSWLELNDIRAYLAHGAAEITLDAKSNWYAIFCMTVYNNDKPDIRRWAISESEAQEFSIELEDCEKQLGSQLMLVRQCLSEPPIVAESSGEQAVVEIAAAVSKPKSVPEPKAVTKSAPKVEAKFPPSKARPLILKALKELGEECDWVNLGPVGTHLSKSTAGFDSKHYGHSTLSALVTAAGGFEMKKEPAGPTLIRVKPANKTVKSCA